LKNQTKLKNNENLIYIKKSPKKIWYIIYFVVIGENQIILNDKTPDSKIDRIERKQISQNRFIKIFNEVNEESMLKR
jgi:hypothetical protein